MNRFVSTLLLLLVIINGLESGPKFCDIQEFDSVYNVGDNIEFVRCGEVWTWDPNIKGQKGGFTRDYSWWHFAKQKLGPAIIKKMGSYDDKHLIYTGFKIENIECQEWYLDLERDCDYSAQLWNTISMIAMNETIVVFRYDGMNFDHSNAINPFGMPPIQNWFDSNRVRYNFWPDLSQLMPSYSFKPKDPKISALLFSKVQSKLYVVLVSPDEKYHCITYLNMKDMLFDTRLHPSKTMKDPNYRFKWSRGICFVGNIVGMFEKDGKSFIVGRILYQNRVFADQVYSLHSDDNAVVINPMNIDGYDFPHSLGTFFGCPVNFTWFKKTTTPRPSFKPLNSVDDDYDQDDTRKKRSVEEQKPVFHLKWSHITTEIKEDWILLSVMTSVALFMIYRLLALKR